MHCDGAESVIAVDAAAVGDFAVGDVPRSTIGVDDVGVHG